MSNPTILVTGAAGFEPSTALADGLRRFVEWFRPWNDGVRPA